MAYAAITKPELNFNTKLYTGNGTDNHGITGVGFQPDFTWIKPRNEARGHAIFDAVRGATKMLISNESSAEGTYATTLKSFDSDGFNLGTSNDVNKSSNTHVAWNWKANGAGSANTDGSINSTVSVNTTAGFSIVSWTGNGTAGATVGHGLGVVPKMIIMKNLTESARHWQIYHVNLGNTNYLQFDTNASLPDGGSFNNTSPTSSVFTLGSSNRGNENTKSFIAYCFAEKTGYSKFSKYTGNNDANGPYIYTGFKPSFVMLKSITSGNTQNWFVYDNKRDGYNGSTDGYMLRPLWANSSNSEASVGNYKFDIYSNGFKLRESGNQTNGSSQEYIYMAFGQSLVGSNNVPCTAR